MFGAIIIPVLTKPTSHTNKPGRTQVTLGARAVVTIEIEHRSKESKTDIQGNLDVAVKAIAQGSGSGAIADVCEDAMDRHSISIQLRGIHCEKHPTNLDEALKLFRALPTYVTRNEDDTRGVPLAMQLTPVDRVVDGAMRLYWRVKDDTLMVVTSLYEQYSVLLADLTVMLGSKPHKALVAFPRFITSCGEQLLDAVSKMRAMVAGTLLRTLPRLRGSSTSAEAEQRLVQLTEQVRTSGAGPVKLRDAYHQLRAKLCSLDSDRRFDQPGEAALLPQLEAGSAEGCMLRATTAEQLTSVGTAVASTAKATNQLLVFFYKDPSNRPLAAATELAAIEQHNTECEAKRAAERDLSAVSYTHLTLPTIYSV